MNWPHTVGLLPVCTRTHWPKPDRREVEPEIGWTRFQRQPRQARGNGAQGCPARGPAAARRSRCQIFRARLGRADQLITVLRRGTGAGDLLAQDLASFTKSLDLTPLGTWGQASVPGCSWSGVNCSAQGWTLSLHGQALGGAPARLACFPGLCFLKPPSTPPEKGPDTRRRAVRQLDRAGQLQQAHRREQHVLLQERRRAALTLHGRRPELVRQPAGVHPAGHLGVGLPRADQPGPQRPVPHGCVRGQTALAAWPHLG